MMTIQEHIERNPYKSHPLKVTQIFPKTRKRKTIYKGTVEEAMKNEELKPYLNEKITLWGRNEICFGHKK